MTTLRKGSVGDDVALLQNSLGGLVADGRFGVKTEAAVKKFQENNGLVVDGLCGRLTAKKLGILEKIEEIQAAQNIILDCPNIKQQALPHGPKIYGKDKTYSTYASGGCGPTSITCVVQAYYDESTTVEEIGDLCIKGGYRPKGKGTSGGAINYVLKKFDGHAETTTSVDKILKAIKEGHLVILLIKKGFNSGYSGQGHYIVAYGIQDGKLLLRDVGAKSARRQWAYISSLPTGIKSAYICYQE